MVQPTHPTPTPAPAGSYARTAAEQTRTRLEHRALVARRERYRRAQALVGDLIEQLGQLGVAADPSRRLEMQEGARQSVGTIVRLLSPAGLIPAVRHTGGDPDQLDGWVALLDELLTDAHIGYLGAHGRAVALAASIAVGIDRLAELGPRAEAHG